MPLTKISHSKSDPGGQKQASKERPKFNTFVTSDRLRESSTLPMASSIPKGRKSIFKEEGLGVSERNVQPRRASTGLEEIEDREFVEIAGIRSESTEKHTSKRRHSEGQYGSKSGGVGVTRWLSKLAKGEKRPKIKSAASTTPPSSVGGLSRATVIALLIAVVLPSSSYHNGRQTVAVGGADAALIRTPANAHATRQNSPTDVCARWAGQSAVINGTMYIYGARSKTTEDQTSDTWTNDFLTLDLTQSWEISSPALTGLPQPDGPPAVSLGYLWNDYHQLFLYGGEFSDNPVEAPAPVSLWAYDVASATWTEHADPRTSAGNYSTDADQPVQRAAEGAGLSVPELGVSWYFGGHLDAYTTPGWSVDVGRVYLRSLLEFTHPGYANGAVDALRGVAAPPQGAYRNVTQGGIQDQRGFRERADGLLVYVPGWGPSGVLLGLGGGSVADHETTDAYASMTTIDVYDIATSEWYHQETRGAEAPPVRVNPCAVVFAAPDASSFNVYMYGGQSLLPYGDQTQYADLWILTVPAFTWIRVDDDNDNNNDNVTPAARAGHHCAARDGQLIVVGGYTGADAACDNPGIYAFDASGLRWRDRFVAAAAADHAPPHDDDDNDNDNDNSVRAGSYGYRVPDLVQSVVGGSSDGGATATTPAAGPATGGPFATGRPPVFTVTAPASTATVTSGSGGEGEGGGGDARVGGGSNGGQIAAGVIAGLAGLAAIYLGFCAWLYRRQVGAYKRHVEVANRYHNHNFNAYGGAGGYNSDSEKRGGSGGGGARGDGSGDEKSLLAGAAGVGVIREKLRKHPPPYCHNRGGSGEAGSGGGGASGAGAGAGAMSPTAGVSRQFSWVGQQPLADPPWMTTLGVGGSRRSEDASPLSGAAGGSSSGTGSAAALSQHQHQQQQQQQHQQIGLPRPSEDRSPWGYDGYSPGGIGIGRNKSDASGSSGEGSVEGLMDGREPSFFSVVLGPRRALRVVNGMESEP